MMRDSLIEILKQTDFDYCEECFVASEDGYKCAPDFSEFFADRLLENGVIVPPMKLGQTCFSPCEWRNAVDECRASSITQKADGSFKIRITNLRYKGVYEITANRIGKSVFLTKEEAEKALAKMKGGAE